MSDYSEEEYLLLSGIQHFAFCPRQWALIHIEQLWTESYLTSSGRILHNKVHDSSQVEKRGDIIIARALKVSSAKLGISGECDVVEFKKNVNGISIKNYDGFYIPYPVEYKRGKPKIDNCDRLQLCAQALCLEEMLSCKIKEGSLFYGEPRRREVVIFSNDLREEVKKIILKMHLFLKKQTTPEAQIQKHCDSCSLKNECLPKILKNKTSIQKYLEQGLL